MVQNQLIAFFNIPLCGRCFYKNLRCVFCYIPFSPLYPGNIPLFAIRFYVPQQENAGLFPHHLTVAGANGRVRFGATSKFLLWGLSQFEVDRTTPLDKPFSWPFERGTPILRGLTITMGINHWLNWMILQLQFSLAQVTPKHFDLYHCSYFDHSGFEMAILLFTWACSDACAEAPGIR